MRFVCILLSLLTTAFAHSQELSTSHLHTDLIEKTDVVYAGGYRTNVILEQYKPGSPELQTALISSQHPVFGWNINSTNPDTRQTSCRILVASDKKLLSENEADIWDSGEMETSNSSAIRMGGRDLEPDRVYWWCVKVTDNHGSESGYSAPKGFVTASVLDGTPARLPLQKHKQHPVSIDVTPARTVLLDFGKDAFSQISLTLKCEYENDTITVHLGEKLLNGQIDRHPGGSVRYSKYRIALKKGTHNYHIDLTPDQRNSTYVPGRDSNPVLMPEYIGEVYPFRYCEVENFRGIIKSDQIVREMVSYDFDDDASSFKTADDTLNAVWELCKYSIKATSVLGVYIDGDRERIPYEADALINQLSHYSVDREYSLARYSIDYLCNHATWPTEWILQAVLMAWYDYLYTGDTSLLSRNYDRLTYRTLMSLKDNSGLISTTKGAQSEELMRNIGFGGKRVRDIVDWPQKGILGLNKDEEGEADGYVFRDYNCVVNAFHYQSVRLMSRIAGALGKTEDQKKFDRYATEFRGRFISQFLDMEKGIFRDGIGTNHHSLHANMMPLAFGLVPEENIGTVVEFIKSRRMACSVYGAQFLLDGLYEAGADDYAYSLLTSTSDRSWYNMIRLGSTITIEAWDPKYKPNLDWNHAWGAAAGNIITRQLVGVTPLLPGFEKMRIKPQCGPLKEIETTVPTIRGEVVYNLRRIDDLDMLTLDIPANTTAEVWVPCDSDRFLLKVDGEKTRGIRNGDFVTIETGSGEHTIEIKRKGK